MLRKLILLFLSAAMFKAFSANPVCGWYGGLLLGGTYQNPTNILFINPFTMSLTPGTINHSFYGAIGGDLGYRFTNFRLEGEIIVNGSPYDSLTINGFTFKNYNKKTPAGYSIQGSTTSYIGMVNLFLDLNARGGDTVDYFPYLGVGVGAVNANNAFKLYYNNEILQYTRLSSSQTVEAAQGIAGFGYYLDDYAAVGIDYRYIITKPLQFSNDRLEINTVNVSIYGSFY